MTDTEPERRMSRRWWIVAASVIAVLVIAVVLALTLTGDSPESPPGSESGSPTASPSASGDDAAPDDAASDDTEDEVVAPLPEPVPIGEAATAEDGVMAVITGVTPFTATGSGVGEISGDALRVDVTFTNTSGAVQSLASVSVNLEYGPDATPGSPIFYDPSVVEFTGELAPGESRAGSYVFGVPADEQDSVTVTVSHNPNSVPFVFAR